MGWPAVLETWREVPFDTFAQLSVVMSGEAIRVKGPFAWVAGFEKVRGKDRRTARISRSRRSELMSSRNATAGGLI